MGAYAAQIACAVSGRYDRMDAYRRRLAPGAGHADAAAFLGLVGRAMGMGFEDKWGEREALAERPAGTGEEVKPR
jgi:hypothetical protein